MTLLLCFGHARPLMHPSSKALADTLWFYLVNVTSQELAEE